jgi:hypothetical protein
MLEPHNNMFEVTKWCDLFGGMHWNMHPSLLMLCARAFHEIRNMLKRPC